MKKIILFFFIFCINFSHAEENIFFLDLDYLLNNSNSGKIIINKLKKINSENTSQLKIQEKQIKDLENEISTKKNVISEEELQKRIENLKIKFNQYKIEKDKSNKEFNSIKEVELTNFFKEITPHIEEFMEKNSIKIILDKKNIFIANSNYDITSELINFLNNKK
tara:strand:+ start:88 stop:582 length:495 start_codon:yes stop_codon:yes gene_type:complete